MNLTTFKNILENPLEISDKQLTDLEDLVSNFPYCQIAHVLIAKAYKDRGNMLSEEKLQKAAAYITSRTRLKTIVNKRIPNLDLDPVKIIEAADIVEVDENDKVIYSSNPIVYRDAEGNSIAAELQRTLEELKRARELAKIQQETIEKGRLELQKVQDESLRLEKEAEKKRELEETLAKKKAVSINDIYKEKQEQQRQKEKQESELQKLPLDTIAPIVKEIVVDEPVEVVEDKKENTKKVRKKVTPVPRKENVAKPEAKKKKVKKSDDAKDFERRRDNYTHYSGRLGEIITDLNLLEQEKSTQDSDVMLSYLSNRRQKLHKKGKPPKSVKPPKIEDRDQIIDAFIKNDPSISRIKPSKIKDPETDEDFVEPSIALKMSIVSENLAKINLKQGNVEKAIEIYEALIVKKPEKKSYFAEEIEKLKNSL